MHDKIFSNLLPFNDTEEIGRMCTDFTDCLQRCTDSQVFLGMDMHAEALDTRPLSLLPCSLETRLPPSVQITLLFLNEVSRGPAGSLYFTI